LRPPTQMQPQTAGARHTSCIDGPLARRVRRARLASRTAVTSTGDEPPRRGRVVDPGGARPPAHATRQDECADRRRVESTRAHTASPGAPEAWRVQGRRATPAGACADEAAARPRRRAGGSGDRQAAWRAHDCPGERADGAGALLPRSVGLPATGPAAGGERRRSTATRTWRRAARRDRADGSPGRAACPLPHACSWPGGLLLVALALEQLPLLVLPHLLAALLDHASHWDHLWWAPARDAIGSSSPGRRRDSGRARRHQPEPAPGAPPGSRRARRRHVARAGSEG